MRTRGAPRALVRCLPFFLVLACAGNRCLGQVSVSYLGQTFVDSQVCFYPYDWDDPYSGFLATSYKCQAATDESRSPFFPAAFFFLRGKELISAHHGVLMPDIEAGPRRTTVPPVKYPVSPTATLDISKLSHQVEEHFALIIANTPVTRLSVVPIVNMRSELVPSRTPLLVVRVRRARPAAVSKIVKLDPGELLSLEELSGNAVLFRSRIGKGSAQVRELRGDLEGLRIPQVVLVDQYGERHRPLWEPTYAASVNGNIYCFQDVPEGPAKLVAEGLGWIRLERDVAVGAGVTAIDEPLIFVVSTK